MFIDKVKRANTLEGLNSLVDELLKASGASPEIKPEDENTPELPDGKDHEIGKEIDNEKESKDNDSKEKDHNSLDNLKNPDIKEEVESTNPGKEKISLIILTRKMTRIQILLSK